MFDFVSDLGQSAFTAFTSNDWIKIVLTIMVTLHLSFPISELPGWDDAWARSELRFDQFLIHMCEGSDLTTFNTRVDPFSAGRVVFRVVKDKYDRRVALHTNTVAAAAAVAAILPPSGIRGCPMFDHSMESYISAWDTGFNVGNVMPPPTRHAEDGQPVLRDLWPAITTEWFYDNMTGNNERHN
jgi:hypothetical protein